MKKLIEKIIGKRKEVRAKLVEKNMGDVDIFGSMTQEEFIFAQQCIELSKLNDELLDKVGTQIENMENRIKRMEELIEKINQEAGL